MKLEIFLSEEERTSAIETLHNLQDEYISLIPLKGDYLQNARKYTELMIRAAYKKWENHEISGVALALVIAEITLLTVPPSATHS